jgi:hypothetical protein
MPVDQAGELGGGLHVETAGEFIAKHIKWKRDTPVGGPDLEAFVRCLMIESIPAEFGSEVTPNRLRKKSVGAVFGAVRAPQRCGNPLI